MKYLITFILILNISAQTTPVTTDHNSDGVVGINDLPGEGIPISGMSAEQRKMVMDTEIAGESSGQGEEIKSAPLNMKFQAVYEEIQTINQ